jgi:hypothetical protein
MFVFGLLFIMTLSPLPFHHGTAIVALGNADGLVMAADRLTFFEDETGDAKAPYKSTAALGDLKIAACGRFLCAIAGLNPIHVKRADVEYDFQKRMSALRSEKQGSILQFTKTLQAEARTALHGMDTILKEDDFWKSKVSQSSILLLNQIIGYDDAVPKVCRFYVEIDRDNKRLTYPEPACKEIDISSLSVHIPKLTQSANIVEAIRTGTPQSLRWAYFHGQAFPIAQTLLPQAPPSIHDLVADAVGLIKVESEFNPQFVGGPVTAGIVTRGRNPILIEFNIPN